MPSFTLRLLSSLNFPTNLLRYSRLIFLKKWPKKMVRKVVSIARMLDRSGQNLRMERLLLDRGSLMRRAANLARLDDRLRSYWWSSLRWSQIAYCRLSLNLGLTLANLAATSGQQGLKLGQRVHTSTSTAATSCRFFTLSSRILCVASRQSLELIRPRKMFFLTSVTIWKLLASSSNFCFSPASQLQSASTPSSFSSCWLLAQESLSHQLVREVSAATSSSNLSRRTSFSVSISLGTFLRMKVSRKAIRWSGACAFLLNLMSASSSQMKPTFCNYSPEECSARQLAIDSLMTAMMFLRVDGSFCRTFIPHFCTRIYSSSIECLSIGLVRCSTSDSKKSPVMLPQLYSKLTIVAQFFRRSKRLEQPNSKTSCSSSPCPLNSRYFLVRLCKTGARSLLPKAQCSAAARATLVARMWKSGFSMRRLKRVKSSEQMGMVKERGWLSMSLRNYLKVRRMLPSESLLKRAFMALRTYFYYWDIGCSPFFRKGLRQTGFSYGTFTSQGYYCISYSAYTSSYGYYFYY